MDLILGVEWMVSQEASLDLKQGGIYFGSEIRQAAYWQSARHRRETYPPVKLEERMLPPEEPAPESSATPSFALNKIRSKNGRRKRQRSSVPQELRQPVTVRLNQIERENLTLYEQIAEAQRNSPEYAATRVRIQRYQDGEVPTVQPCQKTLRNDYMVQDDLVWYRANGGRTLVVPINYWRRVIFEYHDSPDAGHPGQDETLQAVARLYHWPAMRRQIKTYIKHCIVCASVKRGGATQSRAPLRPRPPQRPWQTISVNVMGPYPKTRSGNKFILVAIDVCSKWTEAVAVPEARVKHLVEFVEQLCRHWGYPADIITDNGSGFRAVQKHDINHYTTSIYHQRSNPVERRNQELKKLLRVHQRNQENDRWDESLEQILFTLRTRINAATGMAPSEVLLGAPLVRAGEWCHPEMCRRVENNAPVRADRLPKLRGRQEVFDRQLFPQFKVHVDDVRPWEDQPQFQAPLKNPLCRAGSPSQDGHDVRRGCGRATVPIVIPESIGEAARSPKLNRLPFRGTNVSKADIPVTDIDNAMGETLIVRTSEPEACLFPAGSQSGPSGLCGSGARRRSWSSESSSETPDDETRRPFGRFPPVTIEACPDDIELGFTSPDAVPVVGLYP